MDITIARHKEESTHWEEILACHEQVGLNFKSTQVKNVLREETERSEL